MSEKDIHIIKYQEIVEPVTEKQLRGKQFEKMPQPALTTALSTTLTSSAGAGSHVDDTAIAVINNMRTRINELEAVLKKANWIKTN